MWTEIKDDLFKLPLLIKDKELEVYKIKRDIFEKELSKKTIEGIIWNDVYYAKVKDKDVQKYEFPNDRLREIEQRKRLSKGEDYQSIKSEIRTLSEKVKVEELNLEYMKRRFRAAESLTRM